MAKHQETPLNRWPFIKQILFFFLPLSMLLAGISVTFYSIEVGTEQKILKSRDADSVTQQRTILETTFNSVISDAKVMASLHTFHYLFEDNSDLFYRHLAKEFLAFCKYKGIYDQVRFIDHTGMESIRVNFNAGDPVIVPDEQLQFKKKRYYFQDIIRLPQGPVFVSPFDLNIEQEKIEQPLKPMIRIGTPIFDSKGKKRGILLFNFLGEKLIQNLERIAGNSPAQIMLLNAEGYWLKGPRPEDEWGFMFEGRHDKTFGNRFPNAWQQISTSDSGQFINANGLFTFETAFPILKGIQPDALSAEALEQSPHDIKNGTYHWKIVSHIPKTILHERGNHIKRLLILANILLLVLFGIGFRLLIQAGIRQKQAEEERILREKLQAVVEMAGAACHEFSQPLQAISGYAELMEMSIAEDDPKLEKLEKIQFQVKRLKGILGKLLQITRYETKDHDEHIRIIDIDKASK